MNQSNLSDVIAVVGEAAVSAGPVTDVADIAPVSKESLLCLTGHLSGTAL